MANESTTREQMEENGWLFSELEENGDVHVSANFTGTGTVTIHYASMEHGARLYHNTHEHEHESEASIDFIFHTHGPPKDHTIYFDFAPNDNVKIVGYKRNPVISDVKINCQGTLSVSPTFIDLNNFNIFL